MHPHEEIDAMHLRLRSTLYVHSSVFTDVVWPETVEGVGAWRDQVYEYNRQLTAGYPQFHNLPSIEILPGAYREAVGALAGRALWEAITEEYTRLQVQAIRLSDIAHYRRYMAAVGAGFSVRVIPSG